MTSHRPVAVVTVPAGGRPWNRPCAGRSGLARVSDRADRRAGRRRRGDGCRWRGVAVRVDHADDTSVAALFERVGSEDTQRISLSTTPAVIGDVLTDRAPFWEKPRPSAT